MIQHPVSWIQKIVLGALSLYCVAITIKFGIMIYNLTSA